MQTFIFEEQIEQIDFMKIDCEGSEYSIIYNLPKELFKKISNICVETHNGKEKHHNLNSLNAYLKENEYETKTLEEEKYTGYIWAWRN